MSRLIPKTPSKAQQRVLIRCARLILAGKIGRACRLLGKDRGASPLTLKTDDARRAWALEVLEDYAGPPEGGTDG